MRQVSQLAHGRITLAERLAADPELSKAVAARNAERESQATFEAHDREWSGNRDAPLSAALTGSPGARRLRELMAPTRTPTEDPLKVAISKAGERARAKGAGELRPARFGSLYGSLRTAFSTPSSRIQPER